MNKSVKSTLVLVCICAITALMLAVTNAITAPLIQKNQEAAANAALLQVLPEGKDFEKVDLSSYTLPATVTDAYREAGGGFVIQLTTTGYSSGFVIMCGVRADGTVSAAICLSSTETLGYEKTYGNSFSGLDASGVDAVDTISGATKTTGAYRSAVKDAINAATILGGGSVDIRTEEEILADALHEALPSAQGLFTKMFLTEVIEGIDAVYQADNRSGFVAVVGEQFIALDENANVLSDVPAELAEQASAGVALLKDSKLTDLDLSAYSGLPTALNRAATTPTGNYVLEVKGAGYGINGGNEYHPASGEYIVILISLTPEGQIIDCLTVYQAETPNIGSVCGEPDYYSQFVGKTQETYTEVDAIAGATLTTNGYMKAIARAFESLAILKGGATHEE